MSGVRRPLAALALPVLALAAAELMSAGGIGHAPPAAPPLPREVLVAPPTTLASLRGRPAVIHFWASWCGPCAREAAQIAGLRLGARLVGVDWNDSASGARAFVRAHGWRFPNLRDATGSVGDSYGLTGLPTTFVLDARGRIAATLHGPQTAATIERALP